VNIGIKIRLIFVAYGVRLEEPSQRRGIHPRLIIVQAYIWQPDLTRISKAPDIRGIGDAITIVTQGVKGRSRAVALRNDAALVVGEIIE
jgi:hypothetical protein